MIHKKINNSGKKLRILVAPLDWGLGHATRCIPIIKELIANDCEVVIAADGNVKSLLNIEFQQLIFISLPGYHIRYSSHASRFTRTLLAQLPKILHRIFTENRWLKKNIKKYSISAVFSDNRFGFYNKSIPCVYLTHQLLVKTGNGFTEKIAQQIHARFIKKYGYCWVPDFKGHENIAGDLSHPSKIPANVHYIGGLSRFENNIQYDQNGKLLVLISGPEPQRTIFEELMLEQLKTYAGSVILVRGLPGHEDETYEFIKTRKIAATIDIKNHLSTRELNEAMLGAKQIISRSGYTTIMDLIKLKKKAILVPTPGQAEQEYLASHLMNKGYFFSMKQDRFLLDKALEDAARFSHNDIDLKMDTYKDFVREFVQSL